MKVLRLGLIPRAAAAEMVGIAVTGAMLVTVVSAPGEARAADPSPGVEQCLAASEQGQRLRDEGKYSRARALFATCSSRSCPPPVQRECASAVAEVERAMPTVVLVVRNDRDEDVIGVRALVDGTPQRLAGTPIALDPGEHRVRVEAPGHVPAEQAFVATANEKSRVVRVNLVREANPQASESREPTPAPAPASRPLSDASDPPRASAPVPVATWVLGGLAVAAIGTSGVLGFTARADLDDVRALPCARTRTCDEDETRSIKTRLVLADVAVGVAVVAGVAATWIFFSRDRTTTAPIAQAKLVVNASGVALGARF